MKVTSKGMAIKYKVVSFSGGETHVTLDNPDRYTNWTSAEITGNIRSADLLMELLMLTDALRQCNPDMLLDVTIPYFPYARQDRVCSPGDSFSLKVIANIINSQNYHKVTVWDPHSDVTPALLNRVEVIPPRYFLIDSFTSENDVMVCPDAGAIKRVSECAKPRFHGAKPFEMVRADKKRDPATGKILETIVYSDHIGKKNFLIIDDICDGGRTFIELAKKLRPLTDGKVMLYVTHGIFSQGLDPLLAVIDEIYCANPWDTIDKRRIKQVYMRNHG